MWEVMLGSDVVGPVDEDHVLRMIAEGLPANAKVRPAGMEKWKPIGAHEPFADALAKATASVAAPAPAAPPGLRTARIEAAPTAFLGKGCLIQGLGFVFAPVIAYIFWFIVGPLAILAGLVTVLAFLVAGRSAAWRCSACGNPVANREVRVCPTCKASLTT